MSNETNNNNEKIINEENPSSQHEQAVTSFYEERVQSFDVCDDMRAFLLEGMEKTKNMPKQKYPDADPTYLDDYWLTLSIMYLAKIFCGIENQFSWKKRKRNYQTAKNLLVAQLNSYSSMIQDACSKKHIEDVSDPSIFLNYMSKRNELEYQTLCALELFSFVYEKTNMRI